MIVYRATLDVPGELVQFVAKLLLAERRRRGTRAAAGRCPASGKRCWGCAGSATARRRTRWPVTTGSPGPPPTATGTRSSRCSPRRPRTCARLWPGHRKRALPT
jgi:hypothetical protein